MGARGRQGGARGAGDRVQSFPLLLTPPAITGDRREWEEEVGGKKEGMGEDKLANEGGGRVGEGQAAGRKGGR